MAFMREHPGVPYHYSEVARALGVDEVGANRSLVRLHTKADIPVRRTASGTYQWGAPAQPPGPSVSGAIFEVVGRTQDGRIAVRDPETEVIRFLSDK